jgi:hypothetical protein
LIPGLTPVPVAVGKLTWIGVVVTGVYAGTSVVSELVGSASVLLSRIRETVREYAAAQSAVSRPSGQQ